VKANQEEFPIAALCRRLDVSTSGYYAWARRGPSARARRDAALLERIRQLHTASGGTYGAPRIHRDLVEEGHRVGRKRVARLMREAGLRGVTRRKWVTTTQREPAARPAPDQVQRDFTATAPDQCWVADITYIRTWSGFLYLAIVLDVWNRRVVGWATASHMRSDLVIQALDMAAYQRGVRGVIHHSDQGSQYTAEAFRRRCEELGVERSMGSVGDAYDNAMAEAFFATLKCELIHRRCFHTQEEARLATFEYIEGWYNTRRRHSALGYMTPVEFDKARRMAA